MLLLLARHGNTFEAGDKVIWIGARTDLPLTTKGRDQAAALGLALAPIAPRLKRVISGPLTRTHQHAAIASETMMAVIAEQRALKPPSPPPSPHGERVKQRPFSPWGEGQDEGGVSQSKNLDIDIDERLREIDYGLWEGKSSEDIAALGGGAELQAWDSRGEWPSSPGWTPPANTILSNITELTSELVDGLGAMDVALLITSNGILKFFLKLVPGAFEDMAARGALKVATGYCCALQHGEKGWDVEFWNKSPEELAPGPGPHVRPET